MATGKSNSFIENINALANATSLATGSIVQDTQDARDEAVHAASSAHLDMVSANDSEDKAHSWATEGYNHPVEGTVAGLDAEYSAYHWATEASLLIGDPIIDDLISSSLKTWSSLKISNELASRASVNHRHDGVYEPVIVKQSAFNKSFNGTGSVDTVSRSDHNHNLDYESKITTYGTAYNKDFGNTSGSVMEGDRNFDNNYMPLETKNSAYNKNFVIDTTNPLPEEIPRGTHTHNASGVSYDQTNNLVITSSTVQGGMTQLDNLIGSMDFVESSFITAGTTTPFTVNIASANTPVIVVAPLAMVPGNNNNATINNGAEFQIVYADTLKNKIEGFYTVSISIDNPESVSLYLAVDGTIYGSSFENTGGTLTISKYLSGLSEAGFTLSFMVANNDNTNDVVIRSIEASWNGSPKGAVIASGLSVDHKDLTGTGAPNGVHTISDIKDLQTTLDSKTETMSFGNGHFPLFDAQGNLTDSGLDNTFANNLMSKPVVKVLDNILLMTSAGDGKDSGKKIDDFALKNGSISNVFKVAQSVDDEDAVRREELIVVSNVANQAIPKIIGSTLDNFPIMLADGTLKTSTVNSASFALASHNHSIADITSLQDKLNEKYTKVASAPEDNLLSFGVNGLLKDSGMSNKSKLLVGEPI